jgi:hypothetical protein
VYGFHDAAYVLSLSTYAEAMKLQQDIPVEVSLRANAYQRFTTTWPQNNAAGAGGGMCVLVCVCVYV